MVFTLLMPVPGWAQALEFFTPVLTGKADDLDAVQERKLDQIAKRPTSASVTLVRLNEAASKAGSLRMTIPDRKPLDFARVQLESHSASNVIWSGKLSARNGTATLVFRNGNVTGTVTEEGNLYGIEPIGNGLHALIKVDTAKFPPDESPSFLERERRAAPLPKAASSSPATDGPITINLLVAYTRSASGAVGDIDATIQLAMAEANQSYINSNVNLRLKMVSTFEVTYSESGKDYDQILVDLKKMNDVLNSRNITGADIAMLVVNQDESCGQADEILATAPTAFAAVHIGCATGYYSFAHELGHLQGARHNMGNDPTQTPFAYGHGHQHTSSAPAWRTIMAYECKGECARLQYWSNPDVNYNGFPMGTADTSNNARVLNETAATIAAFRNTQAYTRCAAEHENCSFSGTRTVAYGANDKFVYRTASNGIACDNGAFGDPLPGVPKACYVARIGYEKCANEWGNCVFNGTQFVAFGAGSKFAFKLASGSIGCNYDVFGDPAFGTPKACYIGPAGFTYCAAENGQCAVSGTKTVAYGANGQFFYRTVSGPIACSDDAFGNPAVGIGKACFVGPAL
ncbi:M12 family metallo-peptidase [Pseudoduganella violacea]|uniref:Peptidyl-Asp metalloendopeptidase n=1 Tax=Pseudoduganella violacea TaxID=1715466 RepID=A0A7W5B6U1_9BURK|nr:M12 family metallo-peptidase [Pseudoduganella violacea]MBB3117506.1 hypothetical protein [Pseudoduganella violacea]